MTDYIGSIREKLNGIQGLRGARSAVTYKASIFKLQINHVFCKHFSRFTWVSIILYWSTLNGFFGKVGLPGDHNRWLTVIQDRVQKSFRNVPKEKHCTKVNAYTVENRKLGQLFFSSGYLYSKWLQLASFVIFQALDSSLCQWNLDSGFQSMVRFWVPRAVLQFPTRRIPDSKRKNFPDVGIRISLYGANIMYDETFCFYSLVSWLGETVITARNCARKFSRKLTFLAPFLWAPAPGFPRICVWCQIEILLSPLNFIKR